MANVTSLSSSANLNFLLVHDWLPSLGGSETVFQEICSLFDGPVVSSLYKKELFPWLEGRQVTTSVFQRLPFAFLKHYIFSPWMPAFYRKMPTDRFDVLLVDSHSFAHHVRPNNHSVYVCYYHTSARALWNPEIDDRAIKGSFAGLRKWIAPSLKRLDLAASKNPEYVIANSQTTADRLRKNYGREPDEIIYPPVSVKKWLDTPRIDDSEGFLMWGRLIGYKRIDLAIQAAKLTGFKLNIVGSGPMEAKLKAQAVGAPNVVFRGRLPDAELKALMSRSKAVLFPGYEDFGIVPVEAMAAGLPVIALNQGGAAESVAGHGLLLETQTAEALAEKMREIGAMSFDPRRLQENALRFDVDIFREKYGKAVETAVTRFEHKIQSRKAPTLTLH
jgi:glycosyltransferase involved in cell wall biosynthesis